MHMRRCNNEPTMNRNLSISIIVVALAATIMVSCIRKTKAPAEPVKETIVVKTQETIKVVDEQLQVAPPQQQAEPQQETRQQQSTSASNFRFEMLGRLGGDNNSHIVLNGNTGWVSFTNYKRNLRLASYNEATGRLVLKAYEQGTGKYIGTFDGTYESGSYQGVFTNYKGARIDFNY